MSNLKQDNMLEKHYTTEELYNHMAENILDVFFKEEITEFMENSAGDGRMVDFLKKRYNKPVIAFDIENETGREDIVECDYLKTKIEYKKGRVAFINPPFGKALIFIKKSLEECDYCISVAGANSIINFDYDKYEIDTIDVFRQHQFENCKVDICIFAARKKKI